MLLTIEQLLVFGQLSRETLPEPPVLHPEHAGLVLSRRRGTAAGGRRERHARHAHASLLLEAPVDRTAVRGVRTRVLGRR